MAEELGIEVVPFERVGSVRTSDGKYVLAVWRVRRMSDELKVAEDEVAEVEWLTPAQIRAIAPNLQSNLQVLNILGV
jgi:8-oxo-dGTP pyrophosphatase MutT (NUDIX family)